VVNLVGPIIAGILYSFVEIKTIVIINAASFLIAAILELFLNIPDLEIKERIKNPVVKSLQEMKRSFIYLKEKKQAVLGIIIFYALTNVFVVPILSIVSPYYVKVKLMMPSTVYGFVEGIFVLGMIIGGLLISLRPKSFKMTEMHKTMYPLLIAIITMGITAYLNFENKYITLSLYSIGGLGIMLSIALSNVLSLTYIQKEVKVEMLGKVSAFSTAIATASVAPGQLIFGQLLDYNFSLYNILLLTFIFSVGVVGFIKWNVDKNVVV